MTSHGVDSSASCLAATGRMTSLANRRHSSLNSRWSSLTPQSIQASACRSVWPLDAAAAAPLSASGDWGPLLVTSGGGQVPDPLRTYLLDLKPGYIDDPTRAVYNHVWLIGDQSAISVAFQAQIDDLAEVAKVRSGAGQTTAGPAAPTTTPKNPKP